MKIYKNIKQVIVLLTISIVFSGCNEYIEEDIYSGITSENFLNEDNADQLIVGLYDKTRDVYKNYGYKFLGTDIFTTKGDVTSTSGENDYTNLTVPSTNGVWNVNYNLISKANTAINRYENQISWSSTTEKQTAKAYGIAQAKALRALAFFNLAVNYGGVPLELDEPQSIRNDYTRASEEATFTLIIEELLAAIPDLEDNPETGRLSKRAAQHILAEVYLTRAYKDFAGANDFQTAADLAVLAIDGYDIRDQSFEEVFDYDNQVNPEILFAGHWGTDQVDRGNNKHSIMMTQVMNLPGVARTNQYGVQGDQLMMTPYFFSLFADNDTRENVTMHRVLYADEVDAVGSDNIAVGDTIMYFPKQALDLTELTDKLDRYWVYQPDQYLYNDDPSTIDIPGVNYQYSLNQNFANFPIMKKFDERIGNFLDEGNGSRDTYIFRVAETHLLAAEAFLGAGNPTQALFHINRVRERATGVVNHYASIDLDTILVERALELAGESNRWAVLKRMGKLEERIELYNPHVVDHGDFDATKHLLRPIPLREFEISPETMTQNPKYN